jgi:hypothetical protein
MVGSAVREDVVSGREGALRLIDDGADAVGRLAAWTGLLWITALPSRFLFALLFARLVELGPEATQYADFLRRLAYSALLAWLVSLWGRQAFVRACRHTLESDRPPPPSLLRVPARELAGYLVVALFVEALFWTLLLTLVAPVALLVAAGLAAAASRRAGPNPLDALRELGRSVGPAMRLVRLLVAFAVALAFATVNLHLFFRLGLWLASGVAGLDAASWNSVLGWRNPLYRVLIVTGAALLLEPFWLAALTVHVELLRARSSGDDLRRWFAELRSRA